MQIYRRTIAHRLFNKLSGAQMELWRLGTRTRKSGRRHIIAAAGGFGLVNQALTQRPWIQIQFSNKKQNLPIDPKPSLTIGSTEKRRCHVLHYSMASSIPWRMLLLRHKTIEILTQQHDEVRTIVCTCAKACGALAWSFSDQGVDLVPSYICSILLRI